MAVNDLEYTLMWYKWLLIFVINYYKSRLRILLFENHMRKIINDHILYIE